MSSPIFLRWFYLTETLVFHDQIELLDANGRLSERLWGEGGTRRVWGPNAFALSTWHNLSITPSLHSDQHPG